MRKRNPAFSGVDTEIVDFGNDRVFAYFRNHPEQSVLVLANFSDSRQHLEGQRLRLLGWDKLSTDIVSGRTIVATRELPLEPYQYMVLLGLG
jgi:amylosucrase/maltose alpha-D-glucosyltransferase/alpha-amylase